MVEREGRGLRGAEVRDRRPGERHHARVRERGELESGEVAVAQPLLLRARDRREVEARQEARPSVAAAQRDREVDARILSHAHHGGEPLGVARREALPARAAGGIHHDALPHRDEPRLRSIDRRRIEAEAGRRVQPYALRPLHGAFPRRAAKKSDSRRPHSSARTPPTAVA